MLRSALKGIHTARALLHSLALPSGSDSRPSGNGGGSWSATVGLAAGRAEVEVYGGSGDHRRGCLGGSAEAVILVLTYHLYRSSESR